MSKEWKNSKTNYGELLCFVFFVIDKQVERQKIEGLSGQMSTKEDQRTNRLKCCDENKKDVKKLLDKNNWAI